MLRYALRGHLNIIYTGSVAFEFVKYVNDTNSPRSTAVIFIKPKIQASL